MTKNEIKKLDNLWRKKVIEYYGVNCTIQECYKSLEKGINTHHFIGRRNRALRWYIPNGIPLCPGCHTFKAQSAHQDSPWFTDYMRSFRGDDWHKDLTGRRNTIFKGTYEQVYKYLIGEAETY